MVSTEAYETLSTSLNGSTSGAGWSCSYAIKAVSKKEVEANDIEREVSILMKCAHPAVVMLIRHIQTGKHGILYI
jgi:hypothetical protein